MKLLLFTVVFLLCVGAVRGQAPPKELLANAQQQISICFYLQDGVEVLDFAGPMEVFSYAGFRVFTVSKKKEPLVAQGILKIIPDYSLADAPPADILALSFQSVDVTVYAILAPFGDRTTVPAWRRLSIFRS